MMGLGRSVADVVGTWRRLRQGALQDVDARLRVYGNVDDNYQGLRFGLASLFTSAHCNNGITVRVADYALKAHTLYAGSF